MTSRTPLRAVEHHHFAMRGRWLLFDAVSLTVLPSCALDGEILSLAAGEGLPAADLVARAAAAGAAPAHAEERVGALAAARFLLAEGTEPVAAGLREPSKHVTLMVNVSQQCNLSCSYCYVNKGAFDYQHKPIARMTARTASDLVERIFAVFPGFETYAYHFYGGEPLMNFEVIALLVEHAEARAAATGTATDYYITTNGTLLSPAIADFMDAHRFNVYFSIDGDRERHDEVRKYLNGKGSYADVEKNLAYLRTRRGVHLIGSSVIRKGLSLSEAMGQLAGHGANQCKAERVRSCEDDALALVGGDHERYLQDLEGLIEHYIEHLAARRKPMDFRLSAKILQLLTRSRREFFCPAGDRMFGISADGEIYPCALHVGRPQSRLGDVQGGLDTGRRDAFRRRFGPEEHGECRTCWTRHLCGGGCSAMVDRYGHDDCRSLRKESEAAIAVYQHFSEVDLTYLYGLVSPRLVRWALDEPDELAS